MRAQLSVIYWTSWQLVPSRIIIAYNSKLSFLPTCQNLCIKPINYMKCGRWSGSSDLQCEIVVCVVFKVNQQFVKVITKRSFSFIFTLVCAVNLKRETNGASSTIHGRSSAPDTACESTISLRRWPWRRGFSSPSTQPGGLFIMINIQYPDPVMSGPLGSLI